MEPFSSCFNVPGSAGSQAALHYSTVSIPKFSVGNFICPIPCWLTGKMSEHHLSSPLHFLQKREWHWSYMDMPTSFSWFLLQCLLPCNPQYMFPACQSVTLCANTWWSLLPLLFHTMQQFQKSSSTVPVMHHMPCTKLQSAAVCVAFCRIALQAWLLNQDTRHSQFMSCSLLLSSCSVSSGCQVFPAPSLSEQWSPWFLWGLCKVVGSYSITQRCVSSCSPSVRMFYMQLS